MFRTIQLFFIIDVDTEFSVAELGPKPVEPKLFWDLEPEPKINFSNIFCSQF